MKIEDSLDLKNYLKEALTLKWRNDLFGNRHLVLLLEEEVICSLLCNENMKEDGRI